MRMSLSWQDFRFSSSVCRSHFSGGRYKINRGATFMGILDAGAEEPNSKALRYVISGVSFAAIVAGALWYFLRFTPEKHTVERFMNAVISGDTQQGYKNCHPTPRVPSQDFFAFFGLGGVYFLAP